MENEKKVIVTQVRSNIGHSKKMKATFKCLGLGKVGKKTVLPVNSSVLGMLKKIETFVSIEQV